MSLFRLNSSIVKVAKYFYKEGFITELPPKFSWMEIGLCVAFITTPITHCRADNGVANRQSLFEMFGHSAMYSVVPPGNVKAEQESEMVLHFLTKAISAAALTWLFSLRLQAHFWSEGPYLLFDAKLPLLKLKTFIGESRQNSSK